jgi:hypothetical protein
MVYDTNTLQLKGLNRGVPYYFRVDGFNEAGVQKGKETRAF